jgi:hypothetical protein
LGFIFPALPADHFPLLSGIEAAAFGTGDKPLCQISPHL